MSAQVGDGADPARDNSEDVSPQEAHNNNAQQSIQNAQQDASTSSASPDDVGPTQKTKGVAGKESTSKEEQGDHDEAANRSALKAGKNNTSKAQGSVAHANNVKDSSIDGQASGDNKTDVESQGTEQRAKSAMQHQRQISNTVGKVENPALVQQQQAQTEPQRPIVPTAGTNWPDQQNYNASVLQAEQSQNRHDLRNDRPASYQPNIPSSYLHIRAMALQLPAAGPSNSASNNNHVEPPAVVLEARTNLSSARRSFYPRITRTLPELQLWVLALTLSFPAGIFSPFADPPATLTAASGTSSNANVRHADDIATRNYLITITRQFDRILRKPYVLSHPATVALIDCDFSYHAAMPHVGPGSSQMSRRKMDDGTTLARMGHDPIRGRRAKAAGAGSVMSTWDIDGVVAALGLPNVPTQNGHDAYVQSAPSSSKNPLSIFSRASASPQRITPQPQVPIPPGEEDEDEEDLTAARNEITRLELQFERASKAAQGFVERSGAMTATIYQLNQAMNDLANLDSGRPVARKSKQESATKSLTHGLESWSAASNAQSAALMSTLAPGLSYQSYNARTAIDALLRRASAAAHRYSMLVILVQRRREAERLKRARGSISQEEVDWVLRELRDAQRSTQVLTHHLATFTATLKEELREHSRNTHADIQEALLQQARSSMRAHRFALNNLIRTRDSLAAMREGRSVQDITKAVEKLDLRPSLAMQHRSSRLPASSPAGMTSPIPAKVPVRTSSAANSVDSAYDRLPGSKDAGNAAASDPTQKAGEASAITSAPDEQPSVATDKTAPISGSQSLDPPNPELRGIPSAPRAVDSSPVKQTPQFPSPSKQTQAMPPKSFEETRSPAQTPPLAASAAPPARPVSREVPQQAAVPAPHQNASQSMFLPGRNMQRYANPFARMDGSSSTMLGGGGGGIGGGSQATGNHHSRPAFGTSAGPNNAPAFVSGPTGAPNHGDVASGTQSGTPSSSAGGGRPDPWANRSRISASDAARSLAGRF